MFIVTYAILFIRTVLSQRKFEIPKSKFKVGDTVYLKLVISANARPEPYTVIKVNVKHKFIRFPGVVIQDSEGRTMTFYENALTNQFINNIPK
jgi:hypothetical protein